MEKLNMPFYIKMLMECITLDGRRRCNEKIWHLRVFADRRRKEALHLCA